MSGSRKDPAYAIPRGAFESKDKAPLWNGPATRVMFGHEFTASAKGECTAPRLWVYVRNTIIMYS